MSNIVNYLKKNKIIWISLLGVILLINIYRVLSLTAFSIHEYGYIEAGYTQECDQEQPRQIKICTARNIQKNLIGNLFK